MFIIFFLPGNTTDVKTETHFFTTDITDVTQTMYVDHKNSLIRTIWSRVLEHREHFKRLQKKKKRKAAELWFRARKWVLWKCSNDET